MPQRRRRERRTHQGRGTGAAHPGCTTSAPHAEQRGIVAVVLGWTAAPHSEHERGRGRSRSARSPTHRTTVGSSATSHVGEGRAAWDSPHCGQITSCIGVSTSTGRAVPQLWQAGSPRAPSTDMRHAPHWLFACASPRATPASAPPHHESSSGLENPQSGHARFSRGPLTATVCPHAGHRALI